MERSGLVKALIGVARAVEQVAYELHRGGTLGCAQREALASALLAAAKWAARRGQKGSSV